jgi:hypothetical protein
MSLGFVAFLLGIFGVPIALLAFGHRLRRRTDRQRGAFWGAIIGHCVGGTLAVTLGMIPPENWTSDETMRGFAGLWAMLLLPVIGALIGATLNMDRKRQ